MLLTEVSKILKCKKIYYLNKKKISFNFITTNSKYVKKSSIFVINDSHKYNQKYIDEALKNGAIAILTRKYLPKIKLCQFIVNDTNSSLEIVLNKLYPVKPINTLAITGTNGKTSVYWYVSQICNFNNIKSKTYGTLGYYINNKKKNDSVLTTPNFEILHQAAFSNYKNYNFIFEASSHALEQNRLRNFPVKIAAITNISQDHLDFHKTLKNYKKAKYRLFNNYLDKNGFAILNSNIDKIDTFKKTLNNKIKIVTYGKKNSDVNLLNVTKNLQIKYFQEKYLLENINYNKIELENISCAIACCFALNIEIKKILKVLKKISNPPGRLQEISNNKNYKIFVDYAHTPAALKQALLSKTINNYKPNLVFGCGGNRDKDKRSKMGFIANKYAQKIYITDDNPRNESPEIIRQDILLNCPKGVEVPDRKEAIFRAVKELSKKDILIIAGKGHEKFQINKGVVKKLDDVKITKLAVKKNE